MGKSNFNFRRFWKASEDLFVHSMEDAGNGREGQTEKTIPSLCPTQQFKGARSFHSGVNIVPTRRQFSRNTYVIMYFVSSASIFLPSFLSSGRIINSIIFQSCWSLFIYCTLLGGSKVLFLQSVNFPQSVPTLDPFSGQTFFWHFVCGRLCTFLSRGRSDEESSAIFSKHTCTICTV